MFAPAGKGRVPGVVGTAPLPTLLTLKPSLQCLVARQGMSLLATQLTWLLSYIVTLRKERRH